MKKTFLTLVLGLLCSAPLMAQEAAPANSTAVADALAAPGVSYLSETIPAADASFYVYLCSASWCGPCRAIMPKIVAEYPAIKAAGGEIVLLCCDRTPEAGRGYIKKYDAKFPAVMSDVRTMASIGLPGLQIPRGIPSISIVTPAGELIHAGHAATLLNWKSIIKK